MKMKNKLLLIFLTSCSFCFNSFAEASEPVPGSVDSDLKVKISGYGHFQSGFRNQNHLIGSEKNVSANRDGFAFFNDTALFTEISNEINGITYGGKIVLVPTAKRKGSATYNGSHVYLESVYGRFEAGSPIDVASNMLVDSGSITSATGGDWDRYAKFDSDYMQQGKDFGPDFATFGEYFLDSILVTGGDKHPYSNEPGRKISYYTPKFEFNEKSKLQFGLSYTADSSNTGADNPDKNSTNIDIKQIDNNQYFRFDKSVKNAFSGGVSLEQNISDGIDLKVALTGEYGKSAAQLKKMQNNDVNNTDPKKANSNQQILLDTYKLSNLKTYNLGAVLNVGNFSYAGSIGSLGKSLTSAEFQKTGRDTRYYTGAIAYKQGAFTSSVSYFRSDRYKNTVDCVTLGTDYMLAPGFKPYAEISGFSLKGKPEFYPDLQKKKTRGTVALIGTKLSL